ncbi:ABC transporter ATP-binding protein [Rhodococcus sp. H36-A4]|uniref:ABC transporter ATP-binding protein n=1 Tax=Rhodococcus sp. H36-A4 TaxID=3004353 RepID=UPI0022AF4031|nr:ABC transporter ATP-binding protein [Rhodococcus sp. H36-A4]MCZ4077536.1 ABC transporter ATP-binding protein [Rhodococcus sp. H36-A4]
MRLAIESGTFRYGPQLPILDGISLALDPGQVLAILGPNGVGKTTLLRCMVGLLRWTSGSSTLDGTDISTMRPAELWRNVAYVPQARNAASVSLTGIDMVTIGRSAHLSTFAQPSTRETSMAERVMEEIGIIHLRDVPCGQMSGGQFQMVLIARALVAEPSVLVLDEPETGLDFKNQLVVLDLLDSLAHTHGIAVVMNTHYPTHALRIADTALLLNAHHEPRHGPTDEVITIDHMREVFGVDVHLARIEIDGRSHQSVLPLRVAAQTDR